MNRWPRRHSYSKPMNTLTVILLSNGSSGALRLALLAAFSAIFGHRSCNVLWLTLARGTSPGRRNFELDMNPGCEPKPELWL